MSGARASITSFLPVALAASVAALAGCSGDGGGGGGSAEATSGEPGSLRIIAVGGTATAQVGGRGGQVLIGPEEETAGLASEIAVYRSGSADAAFDTPGAPVRLGANPRTISASATIRPGPGGTITGDVLPDEVATGLRVVEGATLTLLPNEDLDEFTTALDAVAISLESGFLLEGTIDVAQSEEPIVVSGTAPLRITAAEIMVETTGLIESSSPGSATNGDTAPAGGDVRLEARGAVIVKGTIRSRGGEATGTGATGGTGGRVVLASFKPAVGDDSEAPGTGDIFMTGDVDISGGAGPAGTGGGGATLEVDPGRGGAFLSGEVRAEGGAGATLGGAGGAFVVGSQAQGWGGVRSSALFVLSGGAGAGASGVGGVGGELTFFDGGRLRIAGAIVARGGAGGSTGTGGEGGSLQIGIAGNAQGVLNGVRPRGIQLSSSIDVSGGSGGTGGPGGRVEVTLARREDDPDPRPGEAPLQLLGYALVDVSGGYGPSSTDETRPDAGVIALHGGRAVVDGREMGALLRNEADLRARGGSSISGPGGNGGGCRVENETRGYPSVNVGHLDASGGDGTVGGKGGFCLCVGFGPSENGGAMVAVGGAGTSGAGGEGGGTICAGFDRTSNSAPLDASGGEGATTGGRGGQVAVVGLYATTRGDLSARGGDGGVTGGDGKFVVDLETHQPGILVNSSGGLSRISGRLDASGGTGPTSDGRPGHVEIDGILLETALRSF